MVPIELLSSESIKSAIDAYAFFQENPDAVDWKGITLKQLLQFIFEATGEQEIQKAIPLLYEIYDKKLQEELNGKSPTIANVTVPAEIKSLLQAWEQFQKAKNKAEQDKLRSQFIYDERILAAKRIKELALEAKTKIEITATPEVDDQISKLKADIQNNPDEFRRIVIQEIKDRKSKISNGQAEKIADTAIQVINSNPYELAVKTALADKESDLLSNLIPDLTKKGDVENVRENLQLSYEEEINNIKATKQFLIDNAILSVDTIEALMPTESFVTREFAITTNPTTENAVYLNPVEVVKITDPSNPPKAVPESFENLFIPAAGKFTGRPLVTPPAPITNTAAEIAFIPTGARIAREQIAKEDPQTATAMILYYEFGVTKGTFETIAKSAGLSNSQIKNFEQRLGEFQNAHPFVAIELARQRAGLTEIQIQGLTQVFKGPQESWYQNTANMAPPITGFQGFVVRAGGQLFGKQIANSFEKSVRNNLAKIAGGEIAKKGKELVAGSLIGRAAGTLLTTFTGGLGAIGSWVLAKAVIGFRSNSGKILGGAGAILGFIAGGPIGALIGAGLGGAIAGVDWKKYAQYALIALTALFSAFLGAIAVPLIVAFVGIPLITALILFIINAGAYVVPPSTGVGGRAGSNPKNCFVLDNTWTEPYKSQVEAAAEEISKAGFYMDKICTKDITLTLGAQEYFKDSDPPIALGGETLSADLIKLFPYGLSDLFVSTFTLAHESGHIAAIRTNLYQLYLDTPGLSSERPTCTYPVRPHNSQEDFAEIVGRYIGEPLRGRLTVWRCSTKAGVVINNISPSASWKDNYPQSWQFGHDKIFEENLRWQ